MIISSGSANTVSANAVLVAGLAYPPKRPIIINTVTKMVMTSIMNDRYL